MLSVPCNYPGYEIALPLGIELIVINSRRVVDFVSLLQSQSDSFSLIILNTQQFSLFLCDLCPLISEERRV